jgi:membrane protein
VEEQLNVTGGSEAKDADAAAVCASGAARVKRAVRGYAVLMRVVKKTVLSVGAHDCLNVAQSTAYSAIVALFPALIVAAAIFGLLPDTTPVRFQLAAFFDRVLPPDVSPLLEAYFQSSPSNTHTVRALVGAGVVSFLGAASVIATLMEGFRRARSLPTHCWNFWERRRRAFELVFLSLVPLMLASLLVVFGHSVTLRLAASIWPGGRASIYAIAWTIRWGVTLGASVGLIAVIYHLGVPSGIARGRGAWWAILPGAVVATAMWFLTTLAFGWYVTRYANYSEVYGSIGAAIALLFWLYLVSLSVLCGAEFNAQFDNMFHANFRPRGRGRGRPGTPMHPNDEGDVRVGWS